MYTPDEESLDLNAAKEIARYRLNQLKEVSLIGGNVPEPAPTTFCTVARYKAQGNPNNLLDLYQTVRRTMTERGVQTFGEHRFFVNIAAPNLVLVVTSVYPVQDEATFTEKYVNYIAQVGIVLSELRIPSPSIEGGWQIDHTGTKLE